MGHAKPVTVNEWLAYIEALHPKSISMGLDRVAQVAKRLGLTGNTSNATAKATQFKIITVAGTNGKGSSCTMLTQIYVDAGYQVGCYTSPHLIRYHERVKVNHQEISDKALCAAFQAVEDARQSVELTYFEMGTLAAMWYFLQSNLDIVILEVGLGGRLDAVNIFDADCAIVTNVDLDHMEYLGDTREKIGAEKAGVYRANQISICGDLLPPESLIAYAKKVGADLKLVQRDFNVRELANGWCYHDTKGDKYLPTLSLVGTFQMYNAAAVVYAVHALHADLPVSDETIKNALPKVKLMGRFQYLKNQPDIIVDVAHNPQAALSLSENLARLNTEGDLIAVFAMLGDKDIASVIEILKHQISVWYIAEIQHPRAAKLQVLKAMLIEQQVTGTICTHESIEEALKVAYKYSTKNDKIIVFGSFFTVAAVLEHWQQLNLSLIDHHNKV